LQVKGAQPFAVPCSRDRISPALSRIPAVATHAPAASGITDTPNGLRLTSNGANALPAHVTCFRDYRDCPARI